VLWNTARKSLRAFTWRHEGADIREVHMANENVRPTERVRDHLRRILNQHTTSEAALPNPVLGPGLQEVAIAVQREANDPGDATRACDQAAIAMCARRSSVGCSSMTIFNPKTGQTVTIDPKLRTRT
jgi:predicted component of type VI protein secretion system